MTNNSLVEKQEKCGKNIQKKKRKNMKKLMYNTV